MEKVKNKFAKAVLDLETYGLQLKPTSEPRIIEQVLSYIAQASALSTYCDTRYSESTTIQNRFADVMNAVIARAGDNIADAITDAIWQTEELCELEGVRHK